MEKVAAAAAAPAGARPVSGGRWSSSGSGNGTTTATTTTAGKRSSNSKAFRAMAASLTGAARTSSHSSTSSDASNHHHHHHHHHDSTSNNSLNLTSASVNSKRNSDGGLGGGGATVTHKRKSKSKRSSMGRFSIQGLNFNKGSNSSSTSINGSATPTSSSRPSSSQSLSLPLSSQQHPSSRLIPTPPTNHLALHHQLSRSNPSSPSTSPICTIVCASHSALVHLNPDIDSPFQQGRDNDRHFQPPRSPAAHPAHTIETSSALKPVIPSPSASEHKTVTVSLAPTLSPSSDSYSPPNSASLWTSTSAGPTPASSPLTNSSRPSSPSQSVRASFHRSSLKPSKRPSNSTSSALRQSSSPLPVLSVVPPPGEDRGDGEARRPAMQRVSSFLPSWDKRTSAGSSPRAGLFGWSSNRSSTGMTGNTSIPSPGALAKINTAAANANNRISLGSSRMQREAFWPAALDIECEKAARILKSFSTDGYLAALDEDDSQPLPDSPSPIQITKKIPRRIIQNAAGIAIFTCMRSGLWMTGSGGSGILIARKSDGTWSPPSGIMLHTPTLSFIIGVDIYDCVLIINNLAALESITKPHVTLGEDVGLTSGPLVSLDSDEAHIRWKDLGNTVLTYMKARGQNQSVNLNGCILAERGNENERFYSSSVSQMDILAGNVSRNVEETKPLFEVIKMAEGRSDYDAGVVERIAFQLAPGDAMIATPKSSTPASPRTAFGIPAIDDPDPFGVLALEMAGLEIREAGTRLRPTSNQFDFNPAPTSPAFSKFSRQSLENFPKSNRASFMSSRTVKSQMTDAGTQTDVGNTPETTPSPSRSENSYGRTSPTQIPEVAEEEEEVDYTKVDLTPLRHLSTPPAPVYVTSQGTSMVQQEKLKVNESAKDNSDKVSSNYDDDDDDEDDIDDKADDDTGRDADDEDELDDSEDDEEPVVFEVAAVQPARTQAVASRVIHAKGSVVTIPKRVPPPLPMRSPARTSRSSKTEIGDVSHLKSPLRQEFPETEEHAEEEPQTKAESSPHLKPVELRVPAIPERKRDSVKSEHKARSEPDTDSDSDSESETEALAAMEAVANESASLEKVDTAHTDMDAANTPTEAQGLETALNVPLSNSDSSESLTKKRTSSVYTGNTETRWSMDGSSLTTPTSDRPFSVIDGAVEDETPRKATKETERIELNEKYDGLENMGSKETTPNTITVV